MNLKKLLILPAGFIFTNIMYVACCKCAPVDKYYYNAVNLLVKPFGSNFAVVDVGTPVTMDSLFIDCMFYTECVAYEKNNYSFLVNSATACKCGSCGQDGIKNKLLSIEITSDNAYNGIPANATLNSLFKIYDKFNSGNNINISVDSMITLVNRNEKSLSAFDLYTKTKPGNNAGHAINIKATFAGGTILTSKTKAIYWQ